MIIHSITPLELLVEQQELPPLKTLDINGGILEGYDTPDGFQTQRLLSTDPSLYLKSEYSPGRRAGQAPQPRRGQV